MEKQPLGAGSAIQGGLKLRTRVNAGSLRNNQPDRKAIIAASNSRDPLANTELAGNEYEIARVNPIQLHERALAAAFAGLWPAAEEMAWQSLVAFEREDGPDSPDVANLSNLLAQIAEARAQYAAEGHAQRAREIMARLGSRCGGPEAEATWACSTKRDQFVPGDYTKCCGAVDLSSKMAPHPEPDF